MISSATGTLTRSEIMQQPHTWLDTVERVMRSGLEMKTPAVVSGAGTSFYAALAVEAAWPGARAIASTDLVLGFERYFSAGGLLISLARSGDSPESAGTVARIQRDFPDVGHVVITCNADGKLAHLPGVRTLLLDPRTNDRSLVMTSSFSNLALAGILLGRAGAWQHEIRAVCSAVCAAMERIEAAAERIASMVEKRVVLLASPAMFGAAREAALKLLEMTAGRVVPLTETYLGLRHGPMSFVNRDTPVVCFVSADAAVRRYEIDLLRELRAKALGHLVGIGGDELTEDVFHATVSTGAEKLPDWLRTPFDIVFAQLLGYHLSAREGLDPDNPSPSRVITRVVQGVTLYD